MPSKETGVVCYVYSAPCRVSVDEWASPQLTGIIKLACATSSFSRSFLPEESDFYQAQIGDAIYSAVLTIFFFYEGFLIWLRDLITFYWRIVVTETVALPFHFYTFYFLSALSPPPLYFEREAPCVYNSKENHRAECNAFHNNQGSQASKLCNSP